MLEVWKEITAEYNGKIIKGSFKFVDGIVTARTQRGTKTASVGGHTPEQLAKNLLRNWHATEGLKVVLGINVI